MKLLFFFTLLACAFYSSWAQTFPSGTFVNTDAVIPDCGFRNGFSIVKACTGTGAAQTCTYTVKGTLVPKTTGACKFDKATDYTVVDSLCTVATAGGVTTCTVQAAANSKPGVVITAINNVNSNVLSVALNNGFATYGALSSVSCAQTTNNCLKPATPLTFLPTGTASVTCAPGSACVVSSLTLTGSTYDSPPTINGLSSCDPGTAPAGCTTTVASGKLTGITCTSLSSTCFTNGPKTVDLSQAGATAATPTITCAAGTCTFSAITASNEGANYASAPTVTFPANTCVAATAPTCTASLAPVVSAYTVHPGNSALSVASSMALTLLLAAITVLFSVFN